MDPKSVTAVILVLCLILVIAVYFLGLVTGKTICLDGPGAGSFIGRPSQ